MRNQGSLGVPAGVLVRFYRGTDATGDLLGEAATTMALLPGQYEVVTFEYVLQASDVGPLSFYVEVDGDELGEQIRECLEDNNDAALTGVECPTAG